MQTNDSLNGGNDSQFSLSSNPSPPLPNDEWELSELIQLVTAELDQAQDTLILKSQNRRLSMMVNQLNLDLQVDVRHDPTGRLLFKTAPPGQPGGTVLKLGFTPALDTQVQETRKSVDLDIDTLQPLTTLSGIQESEIQRFKTVGIHSVNDLHGATQTPAMLTEVSLKAGLDESRLRLWKQWPFITEIKPESGIPGSIVVIEGGLLGSPADTVEVYFQDRLARVTHRTSTRLTVEMPRGVTGSGSVVVKVNDQRTNPQPWRADVVDLSVQSIALKTPLPLRSRQLITFRADLVNQGTLNVAKFPVLWTITRRGTGRPPMDTMDTMDTMDGLDTQNTSFQARPPLDDFPDILEVVVTQETYLHGVLQPQATSSDPSVEFTVMLDEPGTYWVSVTVDPDNTLKDLETFNNHFIREFVVEAAPPPPVFTSLNQFSPSSGRAGDRITLQGFYFNQGTPTVWFGTVPAAIIGTPTNNQIVVRVPSMTPGATKITVQTPAGSVTSHESFSILSSSSYSFARAIGDSLL